MFRIRFDERQTIKMSVWFRRSLMCFKQLFGSLEVLLDQGEMFVVMLADRSNDGTDRLGGIFIPGWPYLFLKFPVIEVIGNQVGEAFVRFLPVVAHLGQGKRFVHLARLLVGLIARRHNGQQRLIVGIGDKQFLRCRLPVAHMRQKIPDRPSLRRNRYLLLLIVQTNNQLLEARKVFLQGIQNFLLRWSLHCQIFLLISILSCSAVAIVSITVHTEAEDTQGL